MQSGSRLARLAAGTGIWPLTAIFAASAAVCCACASRANANFIDLHVYRAGAQAVLYGRSLYGIHYRGLPFTYPPFAAVAFTGLAVMPWRLASWLFVGVSAACVPAMLYLALRLRPVAGWFSRTDAARLALAAAALAVWLEPVRSTLGFGQVNLVLAVLVLADLALPDDSRFKGIGIGIAAGVKLTPLIFVLYLLATRRYRAGCVAAVAFAVTVAAGYALIPAASAHYFWDLNFLRTNKISPIYNDWNQSILGAVARDLGHVPGPAWGLAVLAVGLVGILLAARSGRRGDEATGFALAALTGLLVSPISWTHHWVIVIPAMLLAGVVAWRSRHEWPRRSGLWLSGLGVLTVIGWSEIARREPRMPASAWLHLSWFWLLASQVYVLAGLVVLAAGSWLVIRGWTHRDWAGRARLPGDTELAARPRAGRVSARWR